MRQKELRLALVCYGGVSLAVYMHGVTKEVWNLARASRAFHAPGGERPDGAAGAYHDFLARIESDHDLRLRVLPDILTGASAGGINAVFLAQAIHSGQSLEPLTELWLSNADVDELTDPDAEPVWRYGKIWAQPLAEWFLSRPGNAVNETVAPETRAEVRAKVSRLVRGRWFTPPFSGDRFSRLLLNALSTMQADPGGPPLLPPGYPVDLFVTATDFRGHSERLRLNSPRIVEETEHRLPIGFRAENSGASGAALADPLELVLAARATASFPGAFPPLMICEIDRLADEAGREWPGRDAFLRRIMPAHARSDTLGEVALIDGSVLVNAPFAGAMAALSGRPSQREVDRRFVYIDPRPDARGARDGQQKRPIGFFGAIFGSLSTIPREQPIRDQLERIANQSRDAHKLKRIVMGLRPEIDRAVERLFGRTFFLDRPTPKRLANWRAKAQNAAALEAGFAYQAYAQTKFAAIIERLAALTHQVAPALSPADVDSIAERLRDQCAASGLGTLAAEKGGASAEAIAFFRAHDIGFRIRRLRLLMRRLSRDWESDAEIADKALDEARARIANILDLYTMRDAEILAAPEFARLARAALDNPAALLDYLAKSRLLPEIDLVAEEKLAAALDVMPSNLKQRMLLTYLGFPYYDIATLPLLQSDTLDEYNPVRIDRISPEDAPSIREGGVQATLRGIEFYNFGAFFSRAYRENDYLWGRLHGAERMIDILASTLENGIREASMIDAKWAVFHAILEEERDAGRCSSDLLDAIGAEIEERLG